MKSPAQKILATTGYRLIGYEIRLLSKGGFRQHTTLQESVRRVSLTTCGSAATNSS